MNKKTLPGLLIVVGVSVAAILGQDSVTVGGKHPLEATALAVLLGLLVSTFIGLDPKFSPGVKWSEKFLSYGIVLLGASLDFHSFFANGAQIVKIIVITMAIGLVATILASKTLGLGKNLTLLLSFGTTICGGTAIAVISPIIKANEDETAYAVGVITLWGLAAIFLYPLLGSYLGLSDWQFGVFAGTAIHSTPQVIGAGYVFSPEAGVVATGVKLVRNCFIAPIALVTAAVVGRKNGGLEKSAFKAFPWFLFGYFVTAALRSSGVMPENLVNFITESGKLLVLLSMSAIGLGTSLGAMKSLGIRPILAGLIGALVVAGASFSAISGLL